MQRELKELLKELLSQGWTIEHGRKAFKLRSPKGSLVSCSRTPSCPFAVRHIRADIKRVLKREEEHNGSTKS